MGVSCFVEKTHSFRNANGITCYYFTKTVLKLVDGQFLYIKNHDITAKVFKIQTPEHSLLFY